MSSKNLHISTPSKTAPTPQNTPLQHAPIASGLARPTIPDIQEDADEAGDAGGQVAAALRSNAARTALAEIVQGRLSSLIGKSSGYIESLPVEQKRSLAALQGLQGKHSVLLKDFRDEMWEIERKVRPGLIGCVIHVI